MARILMPVTLTTEAEVDAWIEEAPDSPAIVESEGWPWIAFCTQDGDWAASRHPIEGDDPMEAGGVTVSLETLELPLTVYVPVDAPRLPAPRCEACGQPGADLLPDASGGVVHATCDEVG